MGRVFIKHLALGAVCAIAYAATPCAMAATARGPAKAITLKPLSLVKVLDLDFGNIIPGATAGTVVINPTTSARTSTGGLTLAGGAPQAAQFLTYATAGRVLQVTRGPLPNLTRVGGGGSMAVTVLTLNGPTLRTVSAAGVLDLRVGGTLNVGTAAAQLPGTYSATFDITVTYF